MPLRFPLVDAAYFGPFVFRQLLWVLQDVSVYFVCFLAFTLIRNAQPASVTQYELVRHMSQNQF